MPKYRIRTVAGGAIGMTVGGAHLLYEIQEQSAEGQYSRHQLYAFTGFGTTVGIRAGGYGPSTWSEFSASCRLDDFHGYAILDSVQLGLGGISTLSFYTGPAAGTDILAYGWGISTDASVSLTHGWMRAADQA